MQAIKFRLPTLLSIGFLFFGASSRADAAPIIIESVTVTIGTYSFFSGTCAPIPMVSNCVGWSFPVPLLPGQDLVLTQNHQGGPTQDLTSFNFDTSDFSGPNDPQISITANGVTTVFSDTNRVLNAGGVDFNTSAINNEAQDYGAPLIGPGYQVFLGYADNTHTGACGVWASGVGLNGSSTCFPSPFFSASDLPLVLQLAPQIDRLATFFQGRPGILPDIPVPSQGLPNHCLGGLLADCFEGGVIRIFVPEQTTVPEPAAVTLLLTGIAVLGVRRRGRGRRLG
jgi:hypothetical protein